MEFLNDNYENDIVSISTSLFNNGYRFEEKLCHYEQHSFPIIKKSNGEYCLAYFTLFYDKSFEKVTRISKLVLWNGQSEKCERHFLPKNKLERISLPINFYGTYENDELAEAEWTKLQINENKFYKISDNLLFSLQQGKVKKYLIKAYLCALYKIISEELMPAYMTIFSDEFSEFVSIINK